ncbi:hypothetical protein BB558_004062 [Smittium angustum]|uniref:Palmitoyltransferase n=1 Tax=Smittium angustum TaxID=133377 RepID=A0A2U1IZ28_SMIAN|nr:hypothetical protein BB558_005943 [Smittium angustum]PVZ99911.1 hypothetical protein BB558_004062 [Smittium angustum]
MYSKDKEIAASVFSETRTLTGIPNKDSNKIPEDLKNVLCLEDSIETIIDTNIPNRNQSNINKSRISDPEYFISLTDPTSTDYNSLPTSIESKDNKFVSKLTLIPQKNLINTIPPDFDSGITNHSTKNPEGFSSTSNISQIQYIYENYYDNISSHGLLYPTNYNFDYTLKKKKRSSSLDVLVEDTSEFYDSETSENVTPKIIETPTILENRIYSSEVIYFEQSYNTNDDGLLEYYDTYKDNDFVNSIHQSTSSNPFNSKINSRKYNNFPSQRCKNFGIHNYILNENFIQNIKDNNLSIKTLLSKDSENQIDFDVSSTSSPSLNSFTTEINLDKKTDILFKTQMFFLLVSLLTTTILVIPLNNKFKELEQEGIEMLLELDLTHILLPTLATLILILNYILSSKLTSSIRGVLYNIAENCHFHNDIIISKLGFPTTCSQNITIKTSLPKQSSLEIILHKNPEKFYETTHIISDISESTFMNYASIEETNFKVDNKSNYESMKLNYCKFCSKYVLNRDHHCRWLNTCITKTNYPLFIMDLVLGAFYSYEVCKAIETFFLNWISEELSKNSVQIPFFFLVSLESDGSINNRLLLLLVQFFESTFPMFNRLTIISLFVIPSLITIVIIYLVAGFCLIGTTFLLLFHTYLAIISKSTGEFCSP